jgi:hypothetical protein
VASIRDSGTEPGELNSASLELGRDSRELNPKPDTMGFKQVMDILDARYPLEGKLSKIKTLSNNGEDLIDKE